MCPKMSLSDENPCTTFLASHHSNSRSVDHAGDARIVSVQERTRSVLDGDSLLHRIPGHHGTRYM